LVCKASKKTYDSELQEISLQSKYKDKEKNPPELRSKRRPIDVSVKVWKELVKAYDRVDAWRKSGEESTHVFEFGHNIISNSLNNFYILLLHN